MILSHQEWNAFVQKRFPDLIIEEPKKVDLSKPDEFRTKHISISNIVQVELREAIKQNRDLLEEILIENEYYKSKISDAKSNILLDRHLYVTDDHYGRLEAKAKNEGAKNLNEAIVRLLKGHNKSCLIRVMEELLQAPR